MKRVFISMKDSNLRQKFIIITANFLLWLASKLFKDDEKKMYVEMKDIMKDAYKSLYNLE